VFLSLRDEDKHLVDQIAGPFFHMGFSILATQGTHEAMVRAGIESERVFKVREGPARHRRPRRNGRVQLMINTPHGRKGLADERAMRLAGLRFGVPCITTTECRHGTSSPRSGRCAPRAPGDQAPGLQRVEPRVDGPRREACRHLGVVAFAAWRRCSSVTCMRARTSSANSSRWPSPIA
jgi:hypothetical protein